MPQRSKSVRTSCRCYMMKPGVQHSPWSDGERGFVCFRSSTDEIGSWAQRMDMVTAARLGLKLVMVVGLSAQ